MEPGPRDYKVILGALKCALIVPNHWPARFLEASKQFSAPSYPNLVKCHGNLSGAENEILSEVIKK